jgi:hypothetical protein
MDADRLLELQQLDTAGDQAAHRRAHLPEQVAFDAARTVARSWETTTVELERRLAELNDSIEADEARGHTITTSTTRLQAQLRTVIAPREAEALMHEIELLNQQRNELDDHELAQMETQAELESQLVAHRSSEPEVRAALEVARAELDRAEAAIATELAALSAQRKRLVAELGPEVVEIYEHNRRKHGGVAIARLVGHRCDGCHLDLSPAEMDIVKAARASGIPECPQCGRLLVV